MNFNYFKIAIRKIKNYPWNTVNRVLGLTIGLTACFFILVYVWNEKSYDKFHSKGDNIYRIMCQTADERGVLFPAVLSPHLKGNIPGVEQLSFLTDIGDQIIINVENAPYQEKGFYFFEPELLDIFDFVPVSGTFDKEQFDVPFSLLISESMAQKYFQGINPVGQTIKLHDEYSFTVQGVFKDWPEASHISPQFASSMSTMKSISEYQMTSWFNSSSIGYVLLSPNASVAEISETIGQLVKATNSDFYNRLEDPVFTLQPLSEIHLHSTDILWDLAKKGDIQYIWIIFITGLLILLIACFNSINLSVAQTMEKTNLFAMMKTFGSLSRHNRMFVFCESLIIVFASFVASMILIVMFTPLFRSLTSQSLAMMSPFAIILISIAVLLVVTFLTGAYPAFIFSKIPAISILKKENLKVRGSGIHKILITAQFTISIALISGIFIISRQISMMVNDRLGFDKEQLLIVKNDVKDEDMWSKYELMKSKLESNPGVKSVGGANNAPSGNMNNWCTIIIPENADKTDFSGLIFTNKNYLPVIGANFIAGNDFTDAMGGKNLIVTESLMKSLGETPESIIGKQYTPQYYTEDLLTVVGVVEDLQFHSLHKESNSSKIAFWDNGWNQAQIVVRLSEGDWRNTLASIENTWNEIAPGVPFSFEFMDDRLQRSYQKEITTAKILSIFAVIAILLSSMGVLGITTFIVNRRTKEIGIRKVNGAKISEIMNMLNLGFMKWIAIAFIIATPIIWFVMERWLENFAYKTGLSWWIFALSGIIVLVIALFTISWQSWRAASRNPVEALRYE